MVYVEKYTNCYYLISVKAAPCLSEWYGHLKERRFLGLNPGQHSLKNIQVNWRCRNSPWCFVFDVILVNYWIPNDLYYLVMTTLLLSSYILITIWKNHLYFGWDLDLVYCTVGTGPEHSEQYRGPSKGFGQPKYKFWQCWGRLLHRTTLNWVCEKYYSPYIH